MSAAGQDGTGSQAADGGDGTAPGPGPRPPLHADAPGHFMGSMDFTHELGEGTSQGSVTVTPHMCVEGSGWPLVSLPLTFADVMIGRLASQRTFPRISVTSDLNLRMLGPLPADGKLDIRAAVVKSGRSISVGETEFRAGADGSLVARSLGTFQASPRPGDEAPEGFARPGGFHRTAEPLAEPFTDRVGLEILEAGLARISLREDLLNATQSLQGGMVALLGEVASATGATAAVGALQAVDHLDVRYLAAARVGPFVARAEIEAVEAGRARVRTEIRDPGRDDRLCAIVLATTRAALDGSTAG